MDTTNIFQFLAIFQRILEYFTPKIAIFLPIHLGIIDNILDHELPIYKISCFYEKINH